MLDQFPERKLASLVDNTWSDTGKAIVNNWLGMVYQVAHSDRPPAGARQHPADHLADGRLAVGAGDSDPAETDVLELIAESWRAVGIGLAVRAAGRQAFRKRVQTGEPPISIFYGLANGLATADMSPAELAPTGDRQNNWPLWGRHYQSGGRAGSRARRGAPGQCAAPSRGLDPQRAAAPKRTGSSSSSCCSS